MNPTENNGSGEDGPYRQIVTKTAQQLWDNA
jgi:hypothetical protein